jgi:hypothetical protein
MVPQEVNNSSVTKSKGVKVDEMPDQKFKKLIFKWSKISKRIEINS